MVLRIIGASNGGNVIFKLKQLLRELYAYTMKSAPRDSRRALIRGLRQRFRHRDERKYGWIKKLRMVKVYEIGENQIKKSKKFQTEAGIFHYSCELNIRGKRLLLKRKKE